MPLPIYRISPIPVLKSVMVVAFLDRRKSGDERSAFTVQRRWLPSIKQPQTTDAKALSQPWSPTVILKGIGAYGLAHRAIVASGLTQRYGIDQRLHSSPNVVNSNGVAFCDLLPSIVSLMWKVFDSKIRERDR
jgi:hypothetical protein